MALGAANLLADEPYADPRGRGCGAAPRPRPIAYAHNAAVRIAYQAVGDGPVDIVFSPSAVSNLGATWDEPTYAAFLRALAALGRLRILFDKRGTGLSDPALEFPTTRERAEDAVAVLDAVERAVLFGVCGGGALCAQLAANHPDRVQGLILHNAMARMLARIRAPTLVICRTEDVALARELALLRPPHRRRRAARAVGRRPRPVGRRQRPGARRRRALRSRAHAGRVALKQNCVHAK